MDDLKEIMEKISDSKSVLLVSKADSLDIDLMSALFSLFYTLKRIGKKVNIYPESIQKEFSNLPHPIKTLNSYLLEIPNANKVSDLYYQKNSSLKLFLTLPDSELSLNDIKLVPLKSEHMNPDLIISVGIQELGDLGDYYEKNFKTFFEGFILNIDNQKSNLDFGQINWIEENKSLSEMIHQIVKFFLPNTNDKILLENLLAGMISFYKERPDKILQIVKTIQEKSLDLKTIIRPFIKNYSIEFLTFFENVLKRIKIISNIIPFVIINKEEADSHQKIISFIKMLRSDLFKFPSLLVLWESHSDLSSLGGVFYFPKKDKLFQLASSFKGNTNGKVLLFKIPKSNLAQLIKEISS